MAQFYNTGGVRFYAGVDENNPLNRAPQFIGTSEGPSFLDEVPGFAPIQNDVAGGMLPMDHVYQNRVWQISLIMNRVNLPIWYEMARRPQIDPANFGPGEWSMVDVGTFMVQERSAFPVWAFMPSAAASPGGRPSMPDMRGVYRFWGTILRGPNRRQVGTQQKKIHVQFYCHPVLCSDADPINNNPGWTVDENARWICYDQIFNGVEGIFN